MDPFTFATASGLAACLTCARALIPVGATVIVADTLYYEVALRLKGEARLRSWTLASVDLSDTAAAVMTIAGIPAEKEIVLWLDQPSNWWLETADLRTLAAAVKRRGGVVIVDASVHPLVPALDQGADVVIISLSKYPSNGWTLGGLLLTRSAEVAARLYQTRAFEASALVSEAAEEINKHLPSFRDRFAEVSRKAEALAVFCGSLPGVVAVRYPQAARLETERGGGVIVLEIDHASRGEVAEEIIAQNRHRPDFPLSLACTFGGPRTTFEHFCPRGTANDEVVGSLIRQLPATFCRIGVGNEPLENIRDALALVFPTLG